MGGSRESFLTKDRGAEAHLIRLPFMTSALRSRISLKNALKVTLKVRTHDNVEAFLSVT